MTEDMTIEYIVIGLYMVFMLVAGIVFRRFVKTFADYFRGGSRATWWLVGVSAFMLSFSAWTFTGAAGVAYTSGITVAVIFLANTLGYLSNALVTAPWFRQLRATTHPEIVRERFDVVTQQFYVWLGIVPGMMTAGLTLLGVAVFTAAVLGFDTTVVAAALGFAVLAYATIGGSWSVMATDFLQTLILMPLALLITILSLNSIGGFGGLFAEIERQGLRNHLHLVEPGTAFGPGWALAMLFFVLLAYNSMGSSVKFFACKDGRDARRAAFLAAGLMLVGALLWFIPPIVARLQFADLVEAQKIANPAEASYAVISLQLLPRGLAGLVIVAMFTATMSSLDSHLNHAAAIITQDFYKPFCNPKASDRQMFIVGQIASALFGLAIIAFAVYFSRTDKGGLFALMLRIGSLLGTPMAVPMLLAILVRRVPPWAAMVSVLYGFLLSFFAWYSGMNYQQTVFYLLFGGAAAFLLTMPFYRYTSEAYRARVKGFFEKMHRPVDFEREIGGATDTSQMKIIGWFSFAIGGFILLLTLLPNPMAGRIQIAALAFGIALLGGIMLLAAAKIDRRNATLPQIAIPTPEEECES